VSKGYWSSGVIERQGAVKSKTVVVGLTRERSYGVPVAGGLSRLYVSQKETVARSVRERPSRPGGDPRIQLLKKLSQCLAILQRLSCRKSNKIHNNLKITYIILCHLDFRISLISCDVVQN
jgi:hypothetical protein